MRDAAHVVTDGFPEYLPALDGVFGIENVDYAEVIKPLNGGGQLVVRQLGEPGHASTSLVERHNATMCANRSGG